MKKFYPKLLKQFINKKNKQFINSICYYKYLKIDYQIQNLVNLSKLLIEFEIN